LNIREAYNTWAQQYDADDNKTRDLEAKSLRENLADLSFHHCLELGCGTGKNTEWLITRVQHVSAVDLSSQMLAKAREKVKSECVEFIEADILKDWPFKPAMFDLVTCSLVLEHIQDLDPIFFRISKVITKGGYLYIGELHPFKQYAGSKARFETDS
jgi:ubiquinone/menaquinone biosynthesis C-methylase UbiE